MPFGVSMRHVPIEFSYAYVVPKPANSYCKRYYSAAERIHGWCGCDVSMRSGSWNMHVSAGVGVEKVPVHCGRDGREKCTLSVQMFEIDHLIGLKSFRLQNNLHTFKYFPIRKAHNNRAYRRYGASVGILRIYKAFHVRPRSAGSLSTRCLTYSPDSKKVSIRYSTCTILKEMFLKLLYSG